MMITCLHLSSFVHTRKSASALSKELKSGAALSATDLEAQWQKEAEEKQRKEDEEKRLEDEKIRKEEEQKVSSILF